MQPMCFPTLATLILDYCLGLSGRNGQIRVWFTEYYAKWQIREFSIMQNNPMRTIIMCLLFLSLMGTGISYWNYDSKITEIEDALLGKRFLIPPTQAEIDAWQKNLML